MIKYEDMLITKKVIIKAIEKIEFGDDSGYDVLNKAGLYDFYHKVYKSEHLNYRYAGTTLQVVIDQAMLRYLKESLITNYLHTPYSLGEY